ncbi:MAG TPA: flagellar biosynthetic protein FliO [Xanthobacteraceae bacterium]
MIESLLGMEQLPLPVKLIVAFVIVLGLIALATWVFRRVGGTTVGTTQSRGRQPRLAVIDAAAVDGRRRLVLIRRDNVEHLVMIGGPSDVVIEQNIVRAVAVAPPREAIAPRPPEPPRPAPEPRMEPPPARAPQMRTEPVSRTPREPTRAQPIESPRPRTPPPTMRMEPEAAPIEIQGSPATADNNLADMASKLEAALRRPGQPARPGATPDGQGGPSGDTRPSDAKPQKSVFDSLEEEMASLLGRPPGKQ